MKIRSVTFFTDPGWPLNEKALDFAGEFLVAARTGYQSAGYEVQTTRLASIPFPLLLLDPSRGDMIDLACSLEQAALSLGYDYVSLGPALPDRPESYAALPGAMAATQAAFFSGMLTTPTGEISLPAVKACSEVIARAATLSPDGIANLRFAALANVPPGCPFFPAAYHLAGVPAFALAIEAGDLAVQAFSQASNLKQARHNLVSIIETNAAALQKVAVHLQDKFSGNHPELAFGGLDFGLAPFPSLGSSVGAALESLGIPRLGNHGTLAAVAFLVDALDRADFLRAGFNGLMPPVMEDAVLAQRAAQGCLTIKDLLLYSAVCGTGLDTIPIPGDTHPGQIAAILLDIAALALRLDKPLTARLMPVPGKKAGDPTEFSFEYFVNTRIMAVVAEPLGEMINCTDAIDIHAREEKHVRRP
jgi:hypothetical protein